MTWKPGYCRERDGDWADGVANGAALYHRIFDDAPGKWDENGGNRLFNTVTTQRYQLIVHLTGQLSANAYLVVTLSLAQICACI